MALSMLSLVPSEPIPNPVLAGSPLDYALVAAFTSLNRLSLMWLSYHAASSLE